MTTQEVPVLDDRHVWRPSPRQAEVIQAIVDLPEEHYLFLGYGGAAGGGKTNLLAEVAIEIALQCPGSRTLVGRNHLVDLKTTTLAEFDKVCPPELLHKKYDSAPIYRQIRMPDWPAGVVSTVFFRQVQDAENGIGSEEYGNILLEEAHEIDKRDITYLFGRLRHRPEKKRSIIVGFNPFPSYVTDVFVEGTEKAPGTDDPDLADVLHTRFVPAKVFDNPHLPPNYASMLRIAYADDPYYLAVLLNGEGGVVPNSVYGKWLNDLLYVQKLQIQERPADLRFTLAVSGWDWGTSTAHKAANALIAVDTIGQPWTMDGWESASGSSTELLAVARGQKAWADREGIPIVAAYDRSQGSLKDDLEKIFGTAVGGVRDVEGRIREGRGLISTLRAPFAWWRPGAREVWRYLRLYHRDEKDEIVEVQDDIPDAWHYAIYEAMHPTGGLYNKPRITPLHKPPTRLSQRPTPQPSVRSGRA